jgi:predicted glycosyltransferase
VIFLKIWIDISNAPHVRFFKDVIKYLEAEGEDLIVTARQFGDIHKLMNMYDIDFISVGKHGVSLYDKLRESTSRVYNLVDIIADENVDVALSKHSIELPRISFGLGIPSLYVLDNEHALAANKLTLPLCDRIITPRKIDFWKLMKFGADPNTIIPYNGTSELMHFKSFNYNDDVFKDLNLKLEHEKTILMRPEPSLASYLDADCRKSVLSPIVDELKEHANILILPRFKEQAEIFEGIDHVTILEPPVDTSSIIKACDLVIGAGGTMNREAAILQTPVISCYPGDTLSVDQFYVDNGLMYRTTDLEDITKQALSFIVNPHKPIELKTDNLFELIVNKTYELGNSKK